MYEQFLIQSGLNKEQALVYQNLIKEGFLLARKISQNTGLKRGLVYKTLEQLVDMGLVEKREDMGKVAIFHPTHPSKLKDLLAQKEKELKTAETSLHGIMNQLVSDYNLFSGKPNVQFFEGLEGVKRVLDDSLSTQTEIYTYADLESIEKHISAINKDYVAKREKFGIKKKGIVLDTPFNRAFMEGYHTAVTDAKFITYNASPFQTVMQIYDNKVSYLTLSDKDMIGVIIEDPRIYSMHKYMFEYLWNITPEFKPQPEVSPKLLPSPESASDTLQA